MQVVGKLLLAAALLILASYIFGRVNADYLSQGRLSPMTAVLQVSFFFAYVLSSYAYLDSRMSHVKSKGTLLFLAIILMVAGLLIILFSMPLLGRRSFGLQAGTLYTSGLYRFSRNPQMVASFIFLAGYALLWPSWSGLLWVSLWVPITRLMVSAEEAHLRRVFGAEYLEYCQRTPRHIGLCKRT